MSCQLPFFNHQFYCGSPQDAWTTAGWLQTAKASLEKLWQVEYKAEIKIIFSAFCTDDTFVRFLCLTKL